MYGYHPREKFAIDVGRYLGCRSFEESVSVKKYSGKPDHPAWNPRFGKPSRFPNYWRFVREQGKIDYVIDIHSGDGRDWRAAGLIEAVTYDRFDQVLQERIDRFAK